jgi:signal transduction histidine kinase
MSINASLRWRLVRHLLLLQAILLCGAIAILLVVLIGNGMLLRLESEDNVVNAMREAIIRDDAGRLQLRPTTELVRLRREVPGLWFALRDHQGQTLREGDVPPEYARIGAALDDVGNARIGWNLGEQAVDRPTAQLRWIDAPAGRVQVLTGPGGAIPLGRYLMAAGLSLAAPTLPILAIMALATLLATPVVVRRALAGLHDVAMQAGRIDVERRATRLPTSDVPCEVLPLVTAINGALARLDEGYDRQQRFLVDAAHELRTPIAILQTRIELLDHDALAPRLREDVARLATLAEQLLDLQRLRASVPVWAPLDLVALARDVVADLAPLAVAAGYAIAFDTRRDRCIVGGDRGALQRLLTNLLQNAIEHGGRRGRITVHLNGDGYLDVIDEGNGIPDGERERIFEAFHRLTSGHRGAGLGLHLVQEVAHAHGGDVVALACTGGAHLRLRLPLMPDQG